MVFSIGLWWTELTNYGVRLGDCRPRSSAKSATKKCCETRQSTIGYYSFKTHIQHTHIGHNNGNHQHTQEGTYLNCPTLTNYQHTHTPHSQNLSKPRLKASSESYSIQRMQQYLTVQTIVCPNNNHSQFPVIQAPEFIFAYYVESSDKRKTALRWNKRLPFALLVNRMAAAWCGNGGGGGFIGSTCNRLA